jgi:hypothetical protein
MRSASLRPRNGVANMAALKNAENSADLATPNLLQSVTDNAAIVGGRTAMIGDPTAPNSAIAAAPSRARLGEIGSPRTSIRAAIEKLGAAVTSPIARKHVVERPIGSDKDASPVHKTPVRGAIGQAGAHLKKAANELSTRVKNAATGASPGQSRHAQ